MKLPDLIKTITTRKILSVVVLAIFIILSLFVLQSYNSYVAKIRTEKERLEKRRSNWTRLGLSINKEINNFKGNSGVVIVDLSTGWEFSYNKERLFPSASLVKVPIMVASLIACAQNRLDINRPIVLRRNDKLAGSGSLKNMPVGTAFPLGRLIGLMIYDSDNTATNIITSLLGIDYLNKVFKAFGLKDTFLLRRVADYNARKKGIENYTSAKDMALLFEKLYYGKLGSKRISDQCISILKLTHSNDRIPRYLPHNVPVAHKTGLERNVCHDAGIVFTANGDFIIIVLTRHNNRNSFASKKFIARVALLTYRYFEGLNN